MNTSQIAVRYAKALFLSAQDASELKPVYQDINLIYSAIQDNPDFRTILDNPVLSKKDKKNLLKKSFYPYIKPLTGQFLDIILQNDREIFLPDMARDFIDLYKKQQGITYVELTTTTHVNNEIIEKIKKRLKERLHTEIQLTAKTDPEIIGGFILNIEDLRFDASVRSTLKNLKKELIRKK